MSRIEREENNVRVGSARKLARKLIKDAKINTPPVLIKDLLETLNEDQEIIVQSWALKDKISGFLLQEEGLTAIAYNKHQHVHRQRFTVAHEFGHLMLGHKNISCTSSLRSTDPYEVEANQFAAELLMPLAFMKEDVKKEGVDVESMAKKYFVSEEAMGWRIQNPFVLNSIL